ncbi:Bug family tripartite tricarboxylate transporter substrate binding protein [Comamonas composti]|uniref:Bug family tripartite tricarboxylate transporter substrate binding protein n=1 Tax=Comamonas composti TaxID=408558 RepID=UPI0004193325|nr:tripartite tricarboxylate transporter substrate binding protein [Comamonas composti]
MKHRFARRTLLASVGAAILSMGPALAQADTYPTRPVKIVVPFTPGGTTDLVARLMAQQLQERTGGTFIVENKAGAGGNIGADAVAKAPADGYTLLLVSSNILAINPLVYKKLPFDPATAFAPVSNVVTVTNVFLANPNNRLGIRSMADLLAAAKQKQSSGGLNFGSTGNASLTHLIGSVFSATAGLKLQHVPYKGSAPMLQALYSGEVDFAIDNLPAPLPHITSERLLPLAVTGAKRSAQLPKVPTVAESGFPNFNLTSWFGLLAPAGTDAAVVNMLNRHITEILQDKSVQSKLISMGTQPAPGTPAEFGSFIRSEVARWAPIVKESGASID